MNSFQHQPTFNRSIDIHCTICLSSIWSIWILSNSVCCARFDASCLRSVVKTFYYPWSNSLVHAVSAKISSISTETSTKKLDPWSPTFQGPSRSSKVTRFGKKFVASYPQQSVFSAPLNMLP